jgi:hypothetical protein
MDNKEFKVRIVDLYKDIDKPIINNLYENDQTKEIMELSERSELLLLKKDKNRWVLKDKRKLLKEIDMVKNRKVREFTSSISKLGKNSPNINLMKDTNNKMISDLESIDNLKKSLNDDDVYSKLQNATSINYLSKDNLKEKNKESNKINQVKPWLLLDPNDYTSPYWVKTNNNSYKSINTNKNIIAYIIIQDCNQGGEYFRYFAWFENDNNRYTDIDFEWIFNKPLTDMQHNDVVTNINNKLKYIVNDKFNNKFIKIFEII